MPEAKKLPYVTAYGNITKALEKIQAASTPPRFTQDFLATKLAMKGGSARPVIPFLKRIAFLTSDGTPTDLYKQLGATTSSGAPPRPRRCGPGTSRSTRATSTRTT